MAFCEQCGEELLPGAGFCANCGAPVGETEPQAPATEQQEYAVQPDYGQQQSYGQQQDYGQQRQDYGQQGQQNYGQPYFAMSRQEIKAKAKEMLKGNYGLAILVPLLVNIIISAISGVTFGIGGLILSGAFSFGVCSVFLAIVRRQPVEFADMFTGFKNFVPNCVAGLLVALFTVLWSLLLVIPGLIKAYAYSMTFYILNDQPQLSASEAITASKTLMLGHKWELFVLHLSFILWLLLSSLTFGILYLVYVGPYMSASVAIFYDDLRQRERGF